MSATPPCCYLRGCCSFQRPKNRPPGACQHYFQLVGRRTGSCLVGGIYSPARPRVILVSPSRGSFQNRGRLPRELPRDIRRPRNAIAKKESHRRKHPQKQDRRKQARSLKRFTRAARQGFIASTSFAEKKTPGAYDTNHYLQHNLAITTRARQDVHIQQVPPRDAPAARAR